MAVQFKQQNTQDYTEITCILAANHVQKRTAEQDTQSDIKTQLKTHIDNVWLI